MLLTSTQQRSQFYCKWEMYCLAMLSLVSSRGNQFQAQQGQSPSHPLSRSIQSANQGDTWSFKGRTCPPVIQWPLTLAELGGTPSLIFSISIPLPSPSLKLITFPGRFSTYTGSSILKNHQHRRARNNSLFILLSKQPSKTNTLRGGSEKRGAV